MFAAVRSGRVERREAGRAARERERERGGPGAGGVAARQPASQPASQWASLPREPFSERRCWLAHVGHGAPMEPVLITSCVAAFLLYFNTLDAEFAYDDR